MKIYKNCIMKKLTFALAMGAMAFAANAQELVKDLYAGDAVEVTWTTPSHSMPPTSPT